MCAPLIGGIQAATNFFANGIKADVQAKQLEQQARLQFQAATYAERRGNARAGRTRMAGSELIGENKARLGGSGVDLQSGSPLAALADSRMLNELDAQAVKSNAAMEAFGHRSQGRMLLQQASDIQYMTSVGSFLGGASQIAGASAGGFGGAAKPELTGADFSPGGKYEGWT
jgi:hypothetical protein